MAGSSINGDTLQQAGHYYYARRFVTIATPHSWHDGGCQLLLHQRGHLSTLRKSPTVTAVLFARD
jgi:hypothetical protein